MNTSHRHERGLATKHMAKLYRPTITWHMILVVGIFVSVAAFHPAAYANPDITPFVPLYLDVDGIAKDSGDEYTASAIADLTPEIPPVPYAMDISSATAALDDIQAPMDISQPDSEITDLSSELPAPDDKNRRVHIPILMYHYISDPPRDANDIRRDLSLPGPDFEQQLRYMVNEGYHSITMQQLMLHIQQGAPLPDKPVVLTFDDGYKDAFTVAFPLLKKYGLTGTFFIFTKPINEENREYLSWQEVELMSAAGMEIGCHSRSHPDLREQTDEVVRIEVLEAKKEIESHIHQPVLSFCYPAGAYDTRVVQAVEEAGYWGAVTTQQGNEHGSEGRLVLRRIRVRGEVGLAPFAASLDRIW